MEGAQVFRFRWVGALLLIAALGIVAVERAPTGMAHPLPPSIVSPSGELPHAVHRSGGMTAASYHAALQMPQLLEQVPCTCGCMGVLGHRHNRDCYIDEVYRDGSVRYSTHGIGCAVCQAITRDTLVGLSLGMTPEEITTMILTRYGGQGM
jgi:hypothetical protein